MNNTTFVSEKSNRILYGMRIQTRCSQAEWGQKIGLTQPEVSAIELGKRPVTDRIVKKVADRFGVDPRAIRGEVPMNWSSL